MELFEKVMWKYYNFSAKYINKKLEDKWRKELKNDNFSIICSNCIGGIIYKRLGKEFLSPTINLWMTQRDFIKFAINLQDYLALELEFVESEEKYPIAMLGDIKIHFNHSKTKKEAEDSWNKRKARVNYENIYIILYYRKGYMIDEIKQIEKAKCKNLIVLTSEKIDLNYAKYICENKNVVNGDSFLDINKYSIRTFEKQWDFVAWLNAERNN